jgi:hypothetical protein
MGGSMFQNAFIDISIGLVLMYLMLSLVCTVVNEFIATQLKLRAASLEAGLKQLLDDPVMRDAFYNHGLIDGVSNAVTRGQETLSSSFNSLSSKVAAPIDSALATMAAPDPLKGPPPAKGTAAVIAAPAAARTTEHPAYISSDRFAKALIGSLDTSTPIPGLADIRDTIGKLPPSNMKDALISSLTVAGTDLDTFRKDVATWFDDSMERLGGAYKRQLKWISLIIGLLIAIIVNADSFEVGYALWSDNALRAQMVQIAGPIATKQAETAGAGTMEAVAQSFDKAVTTLRPLPIGWPARTQPAWTEYKAAFWFWLTKLLGWIMTGIALSFGAPFWFDLLSKLVNIRGAGDKPKRADAK